MLSVGDCVSADRRGRAEQNAYTISIWRSSRDVRDRIVCDRDVRIGSTPVLLNVENYRTASGSADVADRIVRDRNVVDRLLDINCF